MAFACDPGFKLTGSSTIRCNNGIWNSTAPLCTGMKTFCLKLLVFLNYSLKSPCWGGILIYRSWSKLYGASLASDCELRRIYM